MMNRILGKRGRCN